jgi:hypothetical protein
MSCYGCQECPIQGTFMSSHDGGKGISENVYGIKANTREICAGEFVFTPLTATPTSIEVATATGNYGVYGVDSFYGRTTGCVSTKTTDQKYVEVERINEYNVYQYPVLNPTLINSDADIEALKGKFLTLNFNATTKLWTVNNTAASASTNLIEVLGGSARFKTLQFRILVS